MEKVRLEKMHPDELADAVAASPVAYVPLGTLEFHGPHLPLGNDALKVHAICTLACARTGGAVLPPTFWGIGGGHKTYPGSIIVSDELIPLLLDNILDELYRNGFRIIVLITGHYPGEQVRMVKEAAARFEARHPDAAIWGMSEPEAFPGERRADHAAKWETSILIYLRPELIAMEKLVGAEAPDAPEATRTLEEMNAPGPLHGILGLNPAKTASRELGEETLRVIVEHLVEWVEHAKQR